MEKITKILHDLESIANEFPVLHYEINSVILEIKTCSTIQEAAIYFDLLYKVQKILSELVSEDGRQISPGLKKFMSSDQRLDTSSLREYIFSKIKKDEYFI